MSDVQATQESNAAPDMTAKVADLEAKLSALVSERDALAERAKLADTLQAAQDKLTADLTAAQGERDKLQGEVTKYVQSGRERETLDALSVSVPHAARTDLRAMFIGLANDGKVDRYPEDPKKAASAVLEILKTNNSAILRAPVGASGGTNPAPGSSNAARKPFLGI